MHFSFTYILEPFNHLDKDEDACRKWEREFCIAAENYLNGQDGASRLELVLELANEEREEIIREWRDGDDDDDTIASVGFIILPPSQASKYRQADQWFHSSSNVKARACAAESFQRFVKDAWDYAAKEADRLTKSN